MSFSFDFQTEQSFSRKFFHLNWGLVALVTLIAAIGFMALYSAANWNLDPWASKQIIRFCVGFIIMLGVAMIDIRFWYRMSYPIFIIGSFCWSSLNSWARWGWARSAGSISGSYKSSHRN
jgi:cell division protein FtsW (lipid II flippase)